jgi:dienelactone hydrolase
LILVVCIAWALLAPVPVRAQPPGALPPDALIRIASAGDSTQHPVILLLHGRGGYQGAKDIYDRCADRLASHGYDVYAVQYYDANDERVIKQSYFQSVGGGRTFSSGGSVAGSPP